MSLSRREFLIDSASTGLFAPLFGGTGRSSNYPFQHGVASGDPLTDRVILWSRVTSTDSVEVVSCRWMIATDVKLTQVVSQGYFNTDASRDFTVKVDVDGLNPGTTYYYAFEALGQTSDIGRTRTLPEGSVDHLRIAYTSCSNFAKGQFNVYRELANRADLDAVLHLGDYIYEYGDIEDSVRTGRINEPLHETKTLTDYRLRHACYKRDKDLQEVHRQHPFLVIWDDHEIANNAWPGGAANHDDALEGSWMDRLKAGVRAYLEWMPIREPSGLQKGIYRSFRFGDLADLSLLDTRLAGRTEQAANMLERDSSDRTLLGFEQEAWLETRLATAQQEGVTWKLTGQQVMVGQLGTNETPFNYDQWDGYPAARTRLFDAVERANVENWVVLTGDIHSSWAMELHRDPFEDSLGKPIGLEFVTPAVTSPGIENKTRADLASASLETLLPHLRFVDFYYRGYVLLDILPERLQVEWWVVDRIDSHRYNKECLQALEVPAGAHRMAPAMSLSAQKAAPEPAPSFSQEFAFLRQWRRGDLSQTGGMVADLGSL